MHLGLVMSKSGRLELGDNIYGQYRSVFNHCDVLASKEIEIGEKTQNKGYYTVQGHQGRYHRKPVCDFLLVIKHSDFCSFKGVTYVTLTLGEVNFG